MLMPARLSQQDKIAEQEMGELEENQAPEEFSQAGAPMDYEEIYEENQEN